MLTIILNDEEQVICLRNLIARGLIMHMCEIVAIGNFTAYISRCGMTFYIEANALLELSAQLV